MQKPLIVIPGKRLCLFLLVGLLALQSAFTPALAGERPATRPYTVYSDTSASSGITSHLFSIISKLNVYDSLHLQEMGLSKKVFTMALKGMAKLVRTRHIKDNLLAIVDFSQPSINKRLYVIDLNTYQLLYNTYVAHGMKTGKDKAISFSNRMSSNKSSLGFYVTGLAYNGSNGYSLKLQGMEKGINDYAMKRGIVIHGADYVSEDLINSQGYIGRSWGCPAVAPEVSQPLIDLLKEGSCLFIYASNNAYQNKSSLVK
ncbi:MAG: murein L,D-transpeptidase catalytic domain family protein [Niastella sp.]|uniref:murein L,D-transpeptidase catalytic domain family protein n=1 Tax=Niastella sp. TaxID=1869183 RepID=UPI00389A9014